MMDFSLVVSAILLAAIILIAADLAALVIFSL